MLVRKTIVFHDVCILCVCLWCMCVCVCVLVCWVFKCICVYVRFKVPWPKTSLVHKLQGGRGHWTGNYTSFIAKFLSFLC